jgi:hypothetical protein
VAAIVIRRILAIGEDLKRGVRSITEIVFFDEEEMTFYFFSRTVTTLLANAPSTGRFAMHRRIARVTLPIWLYVSVTGVVVFVFLKAYVY